jgi:aminoglycoside phosphotransferase (APT) family kinase protein
MSMTRVEQHGVPGKPAAEVELDEADVHALLAEQHADLARLPLERVESGWDNQLWRLGGALAVRMPRRLAAAALIEHEQRWLPTLEARLPLPIPTPVHFGAPGPCAQPGRSYPWRWSIVPWLPGTTADLTPPRSNQARVLARFLAKLHVAPPADAPFNPYRSTPLSARRVNIEARMTRLEERGIEFGRRIRTIWGRALDAPMDLEPTWIHCDLHPRNLLVEDGALSAVIDWGDMAAGDPATDLATLWMLETSPRRRAQAMDTYGAATPATWARARGWAVCFAVMLLDAGEPRHTSVGRLTLRRLVAD